ncbi:MAG: glycosyltransferase [Thiolinea sp.]
MDHSDNSGSIAYVITSLSMGGAQKVLLSLLDAAHQQTPPLVISLLPVEGLEADFRARGAELFCLNLKRPWQLLPHLLRLRQRLQQRRVRLMYSMLHHANLVALLLRLLVYPHPDLLWGIHDTPEKGLYTRWSHRLVLWLTCRFASVPEGIVLVSGRSRERYRQLGYPVDRLHLIPNGVRIPPLDHKQRELDSLAVRQELGIPADSLLLGSLTRAVPEKDLPGLLSAFATLQSLQPQVHLLLAGEGVSTDNPELTALLHSLHLRGKVHLLGMRHDVPRLLHALDVATLPSRSEAFPLFIAEALAARIPCVATDVGDIVLLLGQDGRCGRLVAPGHPQQLVAAWHELLRMPAASRRQLGEQGCQRVWEHFSEHTMREQHARLFARLGVA